jgi:type I restriction enzyme S subunit
MELKPGYKQTEMGVIPEDWEVQPLQNLSIKIMVGIASAATHAYRTSGVPMFRNQNIKEGRLDDSDLRFLDPAFDEVYQGKRLCGGDLLIARTGYPGTTAVVPPEYTGAQSFTSLITRPNTSRISPNYLCLYINSPAGREFFEQSQIGGAQKNVNANSLKRMPVAFPRSKDEQASIAHAAAEIEAFISSLESLISKKRAIKQAAMQELLTGKRRLPGFEGEWVVKRLGDITSIDPESLGNNTHPNYCFNYISLEDVYQGSLLGWSEQEYVSAPSRARRKLRPNDVLISTVRPNLKSHLLFDQEGGEWICSTGFALLRCNKDTIEPAFVYFHLFGDSISKQIEALLTGSNYPAINSRDVRNLEIPVPALLEQKEIVRILKSMEDELISLAQQFEKASSLKQGMMQQLLTGKIRLR